MTTHDENHITRTSPKRMAKGIAIIAITLAIGAAIAVPEWHNMAKNPPPVSSIVTKPTTATSSSGVSGGGSSTLGNQTESTSAVKGATVISILAGAATQGNPNFDPNDAKIPLGNKVVWQNKDNVPHTATSGSGPSDTSSGKVFDTKIIQGGQSSSPQELKGAKQGDTIAYYCQIHPYMTAKLTVVASNAATNTPSGSAASAGGSTAGTGATLTILAGANIQGNPSYDPSPMTVKKGDAIQVVNKDTTPHTATSGKGAEDPNASKMFDTNIINAGASAKISTASLNAGEYPFFCKIHPYMTGNLKVQ